MEHLMDREDHTFPVQAPRSVPCPVLECDHLWQCHGDADQHRGSSLSGETGKPPSPLQDAEGTVMIHAILMRQLLDYRILNQTGL